jgi:cation:H+ antiporter
VALLVNFEISIREALALLVLFALQFLPFFQDFQGLMVFTGVYLVLGIVVLLLRRREIQTVIARAREHGRRGPANVVSPGVE